MFPKITPKIQTKAETEKESSSVNLSEIDISKSLKETQSLLEFFIVGLSRHLQLKPQQAASLLSNGNKYLAHVIVKGAKNDYIPVINWLSEIYANINHVLDFIEQNELNIGIFFSTIKPGLISKEPEVSIWTLRIFSKIIFELSNIDLHPIVYEQFTKDQGGLSACLMCLKRHPQIVQQVCDVLIQVSRYNINDFFSVQFRKIVDQGIQYTDIINMLFEPLCQSKQMKEELQNTGLINYWSELAIKNADATSPELRASGIRYLTLMWLQYPLIFEEDQNLAQQVLFHSKRATRQSNSSLKYTSLQCLFRLLEHFAKERNPYAAVVYKKLTFSLVENFVELETREFIESNFYELFKQFSTIPIEILLEPLIKNCQVNETSQLNLCDYRLFNLCVTHPRMNLKLAITLSDLLSKILINDLVFAQNAYQLLQILTSRFIENEPMQEFSFKMSNFSVEKQKKWTKNTRGKLSFFSGLWRFDYRYKVFLQKFQIQLSEQVKEQNIKQSQKRALIINTLKGYLKLDCQNLNEQLKPLIVHFYLDIKQTLKQEDKGMLSLLIQLGNPAEIIKEVQEKWEEEKNIKGKEIEKQEIDQQFENEFTIQPAINLKSKAIPDDDPFKQLREEEYSQEIQFLQQNQQNFPNKIQHKQINDQKEEKQKVQIQLSSNKPQNKDQQKRNPSEDKQPVPTRLPKVLENLAQIKLKKEEDELQKKNEQEEKLKREQALQRKAQLEIAKRTQAKTITEINEEDNTQSQINQIVIVNLDEEENRELESVNIVLKQNSKALKYLWSKYSNTTNQAQKKQSFGELQEQFDSISVSDLWRFFKEWNLSENVTRDQLSVLVRQLSQKGKELEFQGFQKLFVQVALFIYSQPINDLRAYPSGVAIEQLFKRLGNVAKLKGEGNAFIEDKDLSNQDREALKEINQLLRVDPDSEIPKKYKKFSEKELNLKYKYNPNLITNLQPSWLDCHEILNGIISNVFKVNLMEPKSEIRIITKAKKQIILDKNQEDVPKQPINRDDSMNIRYSAPEDALRKKKSKVNVSVDKVSVEDTLSVKMKKQRDLSYQRKKPQLVNKALEDKQRQQEEDELKKMLQEEKFKKHQEKVKQNYQKLKEDKEKEDQLKKEEERQRLIAEAEKEKEKMDRQKREAEEKKRKLQEYKEKFKEDKLKKDREEIEQRKTLEEVKKKEREQFMKNQQKEISKMIEEKKKEFKEKEEKEKQKEEKQKEDMQEWKKNVQVFLKEEQEMRAREKQAQQKISQMLVDKDFKEVFQLHEKQIQALYNSYLEYSDRRKSDLLQFKGFANFLSQFNIYSIIPQEQALLIYHTIAREREKNLSQNQQMTEKGMTYEEFNQALLRIAVKGQRQFDLVYDSNVQGIKKSIDISSFQNDNTSQEKQNKEVEKDEKPIEDLYNLVDKTTTKTLEGLIQFFDLPNDRSELQTKLKVIKLEHNKAIAPRDKKKALEAKIEKRQSPPTIQSTKSAKRNQSANRKVIDATSLKSEQNKVSQNNIKNNDYGIVGPNGKKENWSVQK